MYKKFFTIVFVFIVVLLLSGCSQEESGLVNVQVGSAAFQVEIAKTPKEQAKGLSGRKSLKEDRGMLFVYEEPKFASFWMKDMLIPLDFIWIREGEVVRIDQNIAPEDYQPPETITPKQKIDKVLEVNAGAIERYGIEIGDGIELLDE